MKSNKNNSFDMHVFDYKQNGGMRWIKSMQ